MKFVRKEKVNREIEKSLEDFFTGAWPPIKSKEDYVPVIRSTVPSGAPEIVGFDENGNRINKSIKDVRKELEN